MDMLIAALQDTVASRMLVAMLLTGTVASLLALIAPRGAKWLAVAAITLLAAAHVFFGHRLVGAPLVPYGEIGEIGDSHDARCTGHAFGEAQDAARHGRGSTRQVETAR
ncbi:hypothetical protein HIV01_010950 [Lysobacter arenosi]|uniref:Uncharacterized protein n=1 Tax=Lysobacter arenosi TaxID=2795387 RepID=A0ABX7R6Z2_9GAMM|nr:hypothetical protein [Lysobacter arenosi]QSX73755.1 hypothetical protein HIV01_010950 [Lysobacter arenosi]